MSDSFLSLSGEDLKRYVTRILACRFDGRGFILENRTGQLSLDFSILSPLSQIRLVGKRLSGNGKFVIKHHEVAQEYSFLSKVSQDVALPKIEKFDILREGFVGAIYLQEVIITRPVLEEEQELDIKWKNIIHRCGPVSKIRQIDNKLHASLGAVIEHGEYVKDLQTYPANVWTREGSKIKFLQSCQITNIMLQDFTPGVTPAAMMYHHRNQPSPVLSGAKIPTSYKPSIINMNPTSVSETYREPVYLYDSSVNKSFSKLPWSSSDKLVKYINKQDYISIKHQGSKVIPLSVLLPNSTYVFVFNIKKLSGNGRVQVGLITNHSIPPIVETMVAGNDFNEKYVILSTGFSPSNEMHKLHISMTGNNCSGEILLSRIRITNSYSLREIKLSVQAERNGVAEALRLSTSLNVNYSIFSDQSDQVTATAQRYARYNSVWDTAWSNDQITGNLTVNDFNNLRWLNKIRDCFPNLNVIKSKDESDWGNLITCCQLKNITPSKKVWLEPFETFIEEKLETLQQVETVFTPSLSNYQSLIDYLGPDKVKQAWKPLSFITPKIVPLFRDMSFILVLHRHLDLTTKVIEAWTPEMPKLVIAGFRGQVPDHVIALNDYISHDQFLFILLQAKAIVDITDKIDYQSSHLHLARQANIPIVSSNWCVLDQENCWLVPLRHQRAEVNLPSIEILQEAMLQASQNTTERVKITREYNQYLEKFLSELT